MDQTRRLDKAVSLFLSQSLSQLNTLWFTASLNLCYTAFRWFLCGGKKKNHSVLLFGAIRDQLAAVGSTMQPNCSFSILCLFANSRMCNQGWALDGAKANKSALQTIIAVWTIVWCYRRLFPPFRSVSEDGGECNFELNEICIWWLCLCSHYCALSAVC